MLCQGTTNTDFDGFTDWQEVDSDNDLIAFYPDWTLNLPTYRECLEQCGAIEKAVEIFEDKIPSGTPMYIFDKEILPLDSDPTVEDTDGDDASDDLDAKPLRINEDMSYIFTSKTCEDFIEAEALYRYTNFKGNIERKINLTTSDFIENWNSMGLNNEGKVEYSINEVHLVYHGTPQSIQITNSIGKLFGTKYDKGYNSDSNNIVIEDLTPKKINYLNISCCNGGNLDYNNDNKLSDYTDNIALSFIKSDNDIELITAWDGSAIFQGIEMEFGRSIKSAPIEISVGSKKFDEWSIDVNGKKRLPSQRISYWKDDDEIHYTPFEKKFKEDKAIDWLWDVSYFWETVIWR